MTERDHTIVIGSNMANVVSSKPVDHDTGKPVQTPASQYTAATDSHPGFATGLEDGPVTDQKPTVGRKLYRFRPGSDTPESFEVAKVYPTAPNAVPLVGGCTFSVYGAEFTGLSRLPVYDAGQGPKHVDRVEWMPIQNAWYKAKVMTQAADTAQGAQAG